MFLIFFSFFSFHFFKIFYYSPVARHPPPATRHPPPATRHPPPATRPPPPAEKSCRLTLVPRSLLLNRTETLATQASLKLTTAFYCFFIVCAACSQRSLQFEITGIKDYNFAWKCHLEILLTRSYNSVKRLMRWIYTIFPPRVSNINVVYGLALHEFSAVQWIAWDRAPSRCLGGHRFIFVPLSWHADYFIFASVTELKIYHLSFFH